MSLLPKHTQKLTNEWHYHRYRNPDSIEALRDILNPILNPLTFEEVKAWLDKKVAGNRHPLNFHIIMGRENTYRVTNEDKLKDRYFFKLMPNGFHSYKDEDLFPYDPNIMFENLPTGAVDSPLHLFGQMKGYFEI